MHEAIIDYRDVTPLPAPGPGGTATGFNRLYAGMTGAGSSGIRSQVLGDICEAYCGGDCNVALVGWSRGAVIAMGVADDLNTIGCDCSGSTIKPVKVRFVGLFDAVQMMGGNWPQSVPSNVENFAHAKKSARQWIFPTKDYSGTSMVFDLYEPRVTRVRVCSGPPSRRRCQWINRETIKSLHADVGVSATSTAAYEWIKSRAMSAGIEL